MRVVIRSAVVAFFVALAFYFLPFGEPEYDEYSLEACLEQYNDIELCGSYEDDLAKESVTSIQLAIDIFYNSIFFLFSFVSCLIYGAWESLSRSKVHESEAA